MDEAEIDRIMEAAYGEYGPSLRRRLVGVVRDTAAAEDLTQEAFLRLLLEAQHDRLPQNVAGWLWTVARNLATSRGRRLATAGRHTSELVPGTASVTPETLAIETEEHTEVVAALAVLDETGRTAVTMAAHGLSAPEIGRTIGRTPAATRTLLCRSRARVREAVLAAHPL